MTEKKKPATAKKKVAKPAAKKPKVEKKVEEKPKKEVKKVEKPKKVTKPKVEVRCTDKNCPKHSNLSMRGRIFIGTVIKDKMARTVVIEWPRRAMIQKYERYMKKRSRVAAHNPQCINAKVGDRVKITECRPISKTKSFVVIEVVK